MGARDDSNTEPTGSKPELILPSPASVISRDVSSRTGACRLERSLGVAQLIAPSQNSGSLVLGVEPPTTLTSDPMSDASHPSGMLWSVRWEGKRGQRVGER